MLNDRVTLELEGEIELGVFTDAITGLNDLVTALSEEIGGETEIEWELDELEYGSPAVIKWRGYSTDTELVENVATAVETVGKKLESGERIPYSKKVQESAYFLSRIPNGRIAAVHLGTNQYEAVLTRETRELIEEVEPRTRGSFGTVIGTAETVSSHYGFVVTIYDNLFNRAVRCEFRRDQQGQMREMWGNRVRVTGLVIRESKTGRPTRIRDIVSVEYLPQPDSETFVELKGTLSKEGDEPPEETIRRFRDAF